MSTLLDAKEQIHVKIKAGCVILSNKVGNNILKIIPFAAIIKC